MQFLKLEIVSVLASLIPVFSQTREDRSSVLQGQFASWYKIRFGLRHEHQKTQRQKETKCCS